MTTDIEAKPIVSAEVVRENAKAVADMTSTEKRELRAVVRMHFKKLRGDIDLHESNFKLEAKKLAAEKFGQDRANLDAANAKIKEIWRKADAAAKKVAKAAEEANPEWYVNLQGRWEGYLHYTDSNRSKFEQLAQQEIGVRARRARKQIDDEEYRVLRAIAEESLGEGAGKMIVSSLPSSEDLIGKTTEVALAEIEQQMREPE